MTTLNPLASEEFELIDEYLKMVKAEILMAQARFPVFASPHEGYAIIKEEVDELWADIKANKGYTDARGEVLQVAAMAVRYLIDLQPKEIEENGDGSS